MEIFVFSAMIDFILTMESVKRLTLTVVVLILEMEIVLNAILGIHWLAENVLYLPLKKLMATVRSLLQIIINSVSNAIKDISLLMVSAKEEMIIVLTTPRTIFVKDAIQVISLPIIENALFNLKFLEMEIVLKLQMVLVQNVQMDFSKIVKESVS